MINTNTTGSSTRTSYVRKNIYELIRRQAATTILARTLVIKAYKVSIVSCELLLRPQNASRGALLADTARSLFISG